MKIAGFKITSSIVISHSQLLEAKALLPGLEEPHACIDDGAGIVHVAQMRTTQSDEVEHLCPVLLEVRQSGTTDEATQAVCNDAYLPKAASWTVLIDMCIDLLGQAYAHLSNITLSVVFVGRRHQKHNFWEDESNIILDHLHVL